MKNTIKKFLVGGLLALAGFARTPAYAQIAAAGSVSGKMDMGWYLGGSLGNSRGDFEASNVGIPAGITSTSFNDDDSALGYKIFGGYKLNRNFAVEFGYTDLGKFKFKGTTTPPGTASASVENRGWNIDVVGIVPLQHFSLFAKIGLYHNETRSKFTSDSGPPADPKATRTENSYKVGLGVHYDFTPAWGLRAEWERYLKLGKKGSTGELEVDLYSVGAVYRFE
jgi:OOP family OmpA-OmpF porin